MKADFLVPEGLNDDAVQAYESHAPSIYVLRSTEAEGHTQVGALKNLVHACALSPKMATRRE